MSCSEAESSNHFALHESTETSGVLVQLFVWVLVVCLTLPHTLSFSNLENCFVEEEEEKQNSLSICVALLLVPRFYKISLPLLLLHQLASFLLLREKNIREEESSCFGALIPVFCLRITQKRQKDRIFTWLVVWISSLPKLSNPGNQERKRRISTLELKKGRKNPT